MLEHLRITGLGVISDAELEFGPGLTVVTGETGAGKTMVVTGLDLLFGGRADTSRVRADAGSATVEGRLLLPPQSPAVQAVVDAGGDLDSDGSVLVRRVVSAAGRSRAAAGGAAVPAALLARLAAEAVAVHGQNDQQRLARPVEQRATLDRYAGLSTEQTRATFADWRSAEAALEHRRSHARELAREAALLAAGVAEIDGVNPQPGEDDTLAAEASRLGQVDELRSAARLAHDALLGDTDDLTPGGTDAQALLGQARHALQSAAGADPELADLAARLVDLEAGLLELGRDLAAYEAGLDADPARLSQVQARRSELTALQRKYGPDLASVLQWADDSRRRLADGDTSPEALEALADAAEQARGRYVEQARTLSDGRVRAAKRLSTLITAELAGLAMAGARVTVRVSPRGVVSGQPTVELGGAELGASPDGVDEIEILLQPHPDAPAIPVHKGASGGELSRVMLAVEVVLAGTDPVPTLVFDEVDAGVGGLAAVEIGRRLARLAADHQVIVVTHLAQVAAFAGRHLVVDRGSGPSVGFSDIRSVDGEDRVIELTRMLAGEQTEAGRDHARQLLASATQPAASQPAASQAAPGQKNPSQPAKKRRTPARR